MSIVKTRLSGFTIQRVDEKNISFEVHFAQTIPHVEHPRNVLIMTDGEFDLLIETIIAFTDSEPEKEIHFVEAA